MKLLYKPTGNVFDLPEKDVKEILKKDRSNNYAIVGDEKGVSEQTEGKEDKTVYNKVVKETKNNKTKNNKTKTNKTKTEKVKEDKKAEE